MEVSIHAVSPESSFGAAGAAGAGACATAESVSSSIGAASISEPVATAILAHAPGKNLDGLQRSLEQSGLKTSDNGLQFSLRDQGNGGQNQNSNNGSQSGATIVT